MSSSKKISILSKLALTIPLTIAIEIPHTLNITWQTPTPVTREEVPISFSHNFEFEIKINRSSTKLHPNQMEKKLKNKKPE